MAGAAARQIWCHTCGTYVRLGTHGLHESRYGKGPSRELPPADTGAARAMGIVAAIVLLVAGGATIAMFVLYYAWRFTHPGT